jgi:hypothetical protein
MDWRLRNIRQLRQILIATGEDYFFLFLSRLKQAAEYLPADRRI